MNLAETFKIIRSSSPSELEREVNGHRRLGWRLHGILLQDPRTGELFQAVKRPCPRRQSAQTALAA